MAHPELIVDGYRIEPLTPGTWGAFAEATRTMDEEPGFVYQRPKGKGNCVMTVQVEACV